MLKRTPGKWRWALSPDPDKFGMAGIFVEGTDGPPLTPKVGDLQLMAHAPEMHELLYEVADEIGKAIGLEAVSQKIFALLEDINVERQKPAGKKRRCSDE